MNMRLLRYARYQIPDFVIHRLALPLILVAVAAALPTYLTTKSMPPGWMQSAQGIRFAHQMFSQSVTLYLPLGAFVWPLAGSVAIAQHLCPIAGPWENICCSGNGKCARDGAAAYGPAVGLSPIWIAPDELKADAVPPGYFYVVF